MFRPGGAVLFCFFRNAVALVNSNVLRRDARQNQLARSLRSDARQAPLFPFPEKRDATLPPSVAENRPRLFPFFFAIRAVSRLTPLNRRLIPKKTNGNAVSVVSVRRYFVLSLPAESAAAIRNRLRRRLPVRRRVRPALRRLDSGPARRRLRPRRPAST